MEAVLGAAAETAESAAPAGFPSLGAARKTDPAALHRGVIENYSERGAFAPP